VRVNDRYTLNPVRTKVLLLMTNDVPSGISAPRWGAI